MTSHLTLTDKQCLQTITTSLYIFNSPLSNLVFAIDFGKTVCWNAELGMVTLCAQILPDHKQTENIHIFTINVTNTHAQHDLFSLKGSFISDRKRTRKRHRFEWMHRFPSYVILLSCGKDQREFSLSIQYNHTFRI